MKQYGVYSVVGLFVALLLLVVQNYYSTAPSKLPPNGSDLR